MENLDQKYKCRCVTFSPLEKEHPQLIMIMKIFQKQPRRPGFIVSNETGNSYNNYQPSVVMIDRSSDCKSLRNKENILVC